MLRNFLRPRKRAAASVASAQNPAAHAHTRENTYIRTDLYTYRSSSRGFVQRNPIRLKGAQAKCGTIVVFGVVQARNAKPSLLQRCSRDLFVTLVTS